MKKITKATIIKIILTMKKLSQQYQCIISMPNGCILSMYLFSYILKLLHVFILYHPQKATKMSYDMVSRPWSKAKTSSFRFTLSNDSDTYKNENNHQNASNFESK